MGARERMVGRGGGWGAGRMGARGGGFWMRGARRGGGGQTRWATGRSRCFCGAETVWICSLRLAVRDESWGSLTGAARLGQSSIAEVRQGRCWEPGARSVAGSQLALGSFDDGLAMKPTGTLLDPQNSLALSAGCWAVHMYRAAHVARSHRAARLAERHGRTPPGSMCGATRVAAMICVVWSAALGACAMSHGWMPAVVLGATVSRAQTDVARGSSGAWHVRGDVAVAWLPTPPESHATMRRRPPPAPLRGATCGSPTLCLWEREARAQVLKQLVAEEIAP